MYKPTDIFSQIRDDLRREIRKNKNGITLRQLLLGMRKRKYLFHEKDIDKFLRQMDEVVIVHKSIDWNKVKVKLSEGWRFENPVIRDRNAI